MVDVHALTEELVSRNETRASMFGKGLCTIR
jgi:hypothetical protein